MAYKKGQPKRCKGRYRPTKFIVHKQRESVEEEKQEKRVLKRERPDDSVGEDIKRIRESL